MSMFDANDPTRVDRVTMLKVGRRMITAQPAHRRRADAGGRALSGVSRPNEPQHVNPHLHNVPMQIAAERGLPALLAWLWMIAILVIDMVRRLKIPDTRFLAAS